MNSIGILVKVDQEMSMLKQVDIVKCNVQEQLIKPVEECKNVLESARTTSPHSLTATTLDEITRLERLFVNIRQLASLHPIPRHWTALRDALGIRGLRILVKDLLSDPDGSHKAIDELRQQIQGEVQVESMINTIQSHWDVMELEFTKDGFVYRIDTIQRQCLEDASNLSMISKSRCSHHFAPRIQELACQVDEMLDTLEGIGTLQRQWIELGAVFQSESVQRMLDTGFALFAASDVKLHALYERLKHALLVRSMLDMPDLKVIIEECLHTFGTCFSSLSIFLQSQRTRFPALFNLNDKDLLSLLAIDSIKNVNAWIPRLFDGLVSIEFDATGAIALKSKNEEWIVLDEPVPIDQEIVTFLTEIEAGIKHAIRESILPCYESMLSMTFVESKFAHQVIWMCFQAALQASTHMDHLVALARSVHHSGLRALLLFEVFKCKSGHNPVQVTVTKERGLRVVIHGAEFEYCHNYTPLQYTFIRTPTTDSLFYSAIHALSNDHGSNPFGPSGTGKTESVKALGKLLGKQVIVFCCDDSFDCDAFARIFAGMKLSGAWGCFDEFNRLDEAVLSSVSKQIHDVMHDPSSHSSMHH